MGKSKKITVRVDSIVPPTEKNDYEGYVDVVFRVLDAEDEEATPLGIVEVRIFTADASKSLNEIMQNAITEAHAVCAGIANAETFNSQ